MFAVLRNSRVATRHGWRNGALWPDSARTITSSCAYYLDFCHKHGFEPMDRPSLSEPNMPAFQGFFHTCQAPMMPL